MPDLNEKTAIITGGANGIGRAAAKIFIAAGAKVLIVDCDEQQLQAVAKEIDSDRLHYFSADLRRNADIKAYSEFAEKTLGHIDMAVLNAGICGENTPLEEYPEAVFDELLQINLKAVWLGLRAVVPMMKQQKSGSIVMTSSIQGLSAVPGTTAYTTAKHALVGMMKGAALELAPFNIRVNTIHPGYVATPMMDRIHRDVMPDAPQEFEKAIAATVPMKRYAKAEEIAQMILFLASDDSSYSTGSTFNADGGLLAAMPG